MERRLDELYMNADIIKYDPGEKFVFFSDLHIGARRPDDSFQPNEEIFLRALDYYKDWTICLGGDIWDLWKNVSLPECMDSYPKIVSEFDFVHTQMVGNHDRELEHRYKEAYRFRNKATGKEVFWHHGYADDLLNDQLWKASRDVMRNIVAPIEDITKLQSLISPAKNADRHAEVKKRLKDWANEHKITSIFGHIHYQEHDGYYWNDGCSVHLGVIECLEMVNDELTLKTIT